jgi:heme-degrading monooxygenase HmoA
MRHFTSVTEDSLMIARTWRGATATTDAESYVRYLEETGFHEYRHSPGNLGVVCLLHTEGDRTEFLLVSLWTSEEAAITFGGGDPTRAVFYPEDDRFLVDRDDFVRHHEIGYADLHGL